MIAFARLDGAERHSLGQSGEIAAALFGLCLSLFGAPGLCLRFRGFCRRGCFFVRLNRGVSSFFQATADDIVLGEKFGEENGGVNDAVGNSVGAIVQSGVDGLLGGPSGLFGGFTGV